MTVPVYGCRVIAAYPHDPEAFTQGLFWKNGFLYESTGHVGSSTIRKVRLSDGRVLLSARLPDAVFGEGLAPWGDEIVSLTWRDRLGFRWDAETLARRGEFACAAECWGLTQDGENLIMSDGTATLSFLDPDTMAVRRRILVTAAGRAVTLLNALQWVEGEIFANLLGFPGFVRIAPASGQVTGVIDLTPIVTAAAAGDREKVANGIAWDPEQRRLFVTGKNWPRVYEIALVEAPRR